MPLCLADVQAGRISPTVYLCVATPTRGFFPGGAGFPRCYGTIAVSVGPDGLSTLSPDDLEHAASRLPLPQRAHPPASPPARSLSRLLPISPPPRPGHGHWALRPGVIPTLDLPPPPWNCIPKLDSHGAPGFLGVTPRHERSRLDFPLPPRRSWRPPV